MKITLRFITPCFCAGENQQHAEVRASAIRGELRWWFRCLGGTKPQEECVFGTIAGNGSASSILVRVSDFQRSTNIHNPTFVSPNDPESYHHYLLTAPNDKGQTRMWETPPDAAAKKKGVVRAEAQIPAGSSFDLTLLKVRAIQDHHALDTYNRAVECFMAFGSIGYRKSRGFGCWVADSKMGLRSELEELLATMKPPGFTWQLAQGGSNDPMVIFRQIEARLKGDKIRKTGLRLEHRAKDATPLGYSHGPGKRQSSAVYFRPIGFKTKAGDKQYSLLIFQAPDTVLGAEVKSAYKGRTRII